MMNRFFTIGIGAILAAFTLGSHGPMAVAAERATKAQPPMTARAAAVLEEVLQLSNAYFSRFPFISAEMVFNKIVKDGDSSYFLVSVQSADEYVKGHVPGAINIPLPQIAEAKSLARLPRDKKIVFTCDNGHRSMEAALILGQLGFETYAMSMGLSRWNSVESNITTSYPGSAGYPVSTVHPSPRESAGLPVISSTGTIGREAIIERTKAILASGRNLFIDRSEVFDKAVKGSDPGYLLVSLQRPDDYAKGHVPGAINIPYSDIAKKESLSKLPYDKKIVLICYVGHWGASAAFFLNQLGYEAYDMRFGTLGWNDTTDGLGEAKGFLVSLGESLKLPVEKGMAK